MTPADDASTVDKRTARKIQRQRTLSFGKAVEISLKSIKVRFWRSLITMSGIILAIAFLMSIWTSSDITDALQSVPEEGEDKPRIDLLLQKKGVDTVEEQLKTLVISEPSDRAAALERKDKSPYAVLLKDYAKQFRIIPIEPTDPKLAERIADADCIVVDRVMAKIDSAQAIERLASFVSDGGALLVVGSPDLNPGLTAATTRQPPEALMAKLLPVTTSGSQLQAAKIQQPKSHSVTRDIQWKNYPQLTYAASQLQKGAKALLSAENKDPLIAYRKYGRGFAMTYLVDDQDMAQHSSWISGSMLVGQSLAWLTRHQRGGVGAKNMWLIVLSLLVCVVGIVNSMLMSVSERVREIGTMKCLGALDRFIVKLFLLESSFQGIIGTLIGLLVGFILSFIRATFGFLYIDPTTETYNWFAWRYFPAGSIVQSALMAFVIGSLLSVAAAVYPAWNAAKMQPVDAMRVDE